MARTYKDGRRGGAHRNVWNREYGGRYGWGWMVRCRFSKRRCHRRLRRWSRALCVVDVTL